MTKEEAINKLTELKNESEDYSKYALMNEGYRVAMMEAIDLVKKLNTGRVSKRYLFWFESEGKDGWTFEIEAEDSNDAYDKAYDTHGPQVAGMMYQVI